MEILKRISVAVKHLNNLSILNTFQFLSNVIENEIELLSRLNRGICTTQNSIRITFSK